MEGVIAEAGDGVRNLNGCQAGAVSEGPYPDAGDAIRNRDARQASADPEGPSSDAGNAIRDNVIGTCLSCRINTQRSLLFIEQNSIYARVVHVPRANLNRRQAAAATEGAHSDTGDTIRNRDARQVNAAREGPISDTGDAVGDRDARQAGA